MRICVRDRAYDRASKRACIFVCVFVCGRGRGRGWGGGGVYVCPLKPVLILNSQEFSFCQMWLSLFSL